MLTTTIDAGAAMLRADPMVSAEHRAIYLKAWRMDPAQLDEALRRAKAKPAVESAPEPAQIIRREETAALMASSLRAIDHWARQGILRKVRLPGRSRAVGFRKSDVIALINAQVTGVGEKNP